MAAGTESYEAPQYGNLAGAIGEKIGSALTMAAGARRRRDQEIEELNNKEDKTEEEKQRLKDLQSQGYGFIAKKALGTEFGGDLRRRTKGFFQMNPDDQDDPALDKKKRFEALLRAQPVGNQTAPGETPQAPKAVQDGGVLGSFATGIIEKISLLSKKVDDLKKVEQKDQTPKTVVNLSKNVGSIRRFFSKNNKIEEEQVKIAQQQLEQQKEDAADAKQARAEAAAENRNRTAGSSDIDNRRNGSSLKGLLGGVLDFAGDLLGFGRRGGGRRGGGGGRRGGGLLGMFGRRGRRRGMSRSMSRGRTQYTAPIGPQPMNSSTPWARKSAGERGGMFGQGGFSPRMESSPRKMASGGIVDNPTTGQAVIPQNKLTEAVKTNQDNVKKADPFAKVMQLPTMAAGALLMSTVGNVVNNLGGVSKLFRPVLSRMFVPAATAFGLPANLISAFFGAPAQAAGLRKPENALKDGQKGSSGGGGSGTSPGVTPGSTMTGGIVTGGSLDGYQITSGFGLRASPGGIGSTNHQGVDYGTPQGTKLSTKKAGKVAKIVAPAMGNNGEVHVIHDDGTEGRYLHMSKVAVSQGEQVMPGSLLGETGGAPGTPGAGPSTGPHLHFEYYPNASSGPVDGSPFAASMFSLGGTLTPTAPQTPVTPTTPTAVATAATPTPAAATPRSTQPRTLEPIVLPRPAPTTPPAQSDDTGNGGANLPVRNPNAPMSLLGGMP
jgi:murein DD-endopeptidase MepM/ murein hydrolase activator NlpD